MTHMFGLFLRHSVDSLRFGIFTESNWQLQTLRVNWSRLQASRTDVVDIIANAAAMEYCRARYSAAAIATGTIIAHAQREEERNRKCAIKAARATVAVPAAPTVQVNFSTRNSQERWNKFCYLLFLLRCFPFPFNLFSFVFFTVWPHHHPRTVSTAFVMAAQSYRDQSPSGNIRVRLDMVLRT